MNIKFRSSKPKENISASAILKRYTAGERKFNYTNLSAINLRGASLPKIELNKVNLQGANLETANLKMASLWRTNLQGANLRGTDLRFADLQGANCQKANFQEAKLKQATLAKANLEGANFRRADLQEANLRLTNLIGADLSGANLCGASLKGAKLQGANLQGANLQGAKLPPREMMKGANLQGVELPSLKNLQQAMLPNQNRPDDQNTFQVQLSDTGVEVTSAPIEELIPDTAVEDVAIEKNLEILETIDQTPIAEIDAITAAQEPLNIEGYFIPKSIKEAKERIKISIARRQGQSKFRQSLLEAYNYRCAITGCDAQEALEAAHIIPYCETENNHPSNGLLLRADLHTLFDLDLITINPETMQVHLAPSLRQTDYGRLHGKSLQLPKNKAYFPRKDVLQWRCNQCGWYG
jgi:uncharacterized protein YjbI with pentapeptide repeats